MSDKEAFLITCLGLTGLGYEGRLFNAMYSGEGATKNFNLPSREALSVT